MQAIFETTFDVIYLLSIILIGFYMVFKANDNIYFKLFGIMAIVLGFGDAFHLVPRSYALLTTGLEDNAVALGIGKFITSITMTFFYVILYHIWRFRYNVNNKQRLTIIIYILALSRIILCLLPGNDWLNYYQPISYGIYRNIPFTIMGIILIYLFIRESKVNNDKYLKHMGLAIILSFGFYIPVVLFAKTYNWVGILMIPKTLAYVWVVYMGYNEIKNKNS